MRTLEALMELNTSLMIDGYEADYHLSLNDKDFEKFIIDFEREKRHLVFYPELSKTLKDISFLKLAGPGCYFWVHRLSKTFIDSNND